MRSSTRSSCAWLRCWPVARESATAAFMASSLALKGMASGENANMWSGRQSGDTRNHSQEPRNVLVLIPTNQILAWTPFWQEIFKLMANLLFVQALPSMQWTYEDWDVSFKINCLSSHLFLLNSVSRRTNQQRCFTLQTCEAVVLCMYSCFVLPSMQIYI